ncbi:MAG: hypothetical protein ACYDBW_07655 [Sulfuricaulis sp.]
MRKALTLFSTLIAAGAALVWTGTGETSDPMLAVREIPADIVTHCKASNTGGLEACHQPEFTRRWVGMIGQGNLFVVTNDLCVDSGCRAWLVRKTAGSVTTLLAFDKTFRLHGGMGGYPVIETYTDLSSNQGAYSRFEWNGSSYTRTANRLVYRVDGEQCGTREQCDTTARDALRHQDVDRAVKIWENVHGVSWI